MARRGAGSRALLGADGPVPSTAVGWRQRSPSASASGGCPSVSVVRFSRPLLRRAGSRHAFSEATRRPAAASPVWGGPAPRTFPPSGDTLRRGGVSAGPMRHARAAAPPLEIAARRAARASRGSRARRAAGRRCPASCSGSSTPARSTGSPRGCRRAGARLGHERQDDDRRDGGRDPRPRACGWRTTAPARTSSPASPPRCSPRGARARAVRGRRGALPEVARRVRPRALCLGNLFRDQLDRYGELEHVAERWRAPVRELAAGDARRQRRRPAGRRPRRERARAVVFGLDDPRHARPSSSTPPTRSGASAAARRTSTRPPTSGTSATTAARLRPRRRPPLDVARARSSCRARGGSFLLDARGHAPASCRCACRASTTSTTRSRPPRSRCARASLDGDRGRPRSASAPPSAASSGSPSATARLLVLLIKNPAGANEAVRTLVAAARRGSP